MICVISELLTFVEADQTTPHHRGNFPRTLHPSRSTTSPFMQTRAPALESNHPMTRYKYKPWPPTQQVGALPTEQTGRRLSIRVEKYHLICILPLALNHGPGGLRPSRFPIIINLSGFYENVAS